MSTPFKMKSSPAKLWPWGKRVKSKRIEGGYEIKDVTVTRGDVTKTKTSKKLLANNPGDVFVETSKVKRKDGKVVKSKSVVIDKGGHRKIKVKTRKGKTKKVVWEDGERTVTRT